MTGTRGCVAAGHPLTAEAGATILREGGNAVDAAVAAVLTSFAAESPLTGLRRGRLHARPRARARGGRPARLLRRSPRSRRRRARCRACPEAGVFQRGPAAGLPHRRRLLRRPGNGGGAGAGGPALRLDAALGIGAAGGASGSRGGRPSAPGRPSSCRSWRRSSPTPRRAGRSTPPRGGCWERGRPCAGPSWRRRSSGSRPRARSPSTGATWPRAWRSSSSSAVGP